MAKKYDWGDDTKIAIRHFIEKVSNYKPSGNAGDDAIVFLAYIADARCIRLKLDPRPNLREGEICFYCREYKLCSPGHHLTCDNFTREPDGSACNFGKCYFGEVACSSRNTNSTCDHQIAYSMACDNFTGEKAAGLCTSCMRVHICSVANDEITLCGSYKKPTL